MAISALVTIAPASGQEIVADEDAGAEAYGQECRACHAGQIAPSLRGVVDRPIASVASYDGYSDALKARRDQAWTPANLDAFLRDPAAFAPGSKMTRALPDDRTRADIIAYLRALTIAYLRALTPPAQ